MNKVKWLNLCRRYLLHSMAAESRTELGNGLGSVCSLRQRWLLVRALHRCSSANGVLPDMGLSFRKRHMHASATCHRAMSGSTAYRHMMGILGGKVDVPTLYGKIQITIPKGVQPRQLLVLRGKGLPKQGFLVDCGDQYVRFCINLPTSINERRRDILKEFAKEEIDNGTSNRNEGNWLQHIFDHLTAPKFMLKYMLIDSYLPGKSHELMLIQVILMKIS